MKKETFYDIATNQLVRETQELAIEKPNVVSFIE